MIFCSIVTGLVFLDLTGLVNYAWNADHSKLGFVALGLFTITTPFVGYLTNTIVRKGISQHKRYLEVCWFAAECLMGIGMAGTLVGIMMMFSEAMTNLDPTNIALVQAIIAHLSHGFTTAVVTTLIGVVTSMLLKLQLVSLNVSVDDDEEE